MLVLVHQRFLAAGGRMMLVFTRPPFFRSRLMSVFLSSFLNNTVFPSQYYGFTLLPLSVLFFFGLLSVFQLISLHLKSLNAQEVFLRNYVQCKKRFSLNLFVDIHGKDEYMDFMYSSFYLNLMRSHPQNEKSQLPYHILTTREASSLDNYYCS